MYIYIYPGEALEGPISTGVSKNLTLLIQITTYRYEKLLLYIYINVFPREVFVQACDFSEGMTLSNELS